MKIHNWRVRSVVVACSVAAFFIFPTQQLFAAPQAAAKQPFLFGAEWPVDGSNDVKNLFYETGCNFTRLTSGGFGWAVSRHQNALHELRAHHVKVLLQLGSHYPDGGYFGLKDSQLIDQKGIGGVEDRNAWAISYNGSAWPQYSYASDSFRDRLKGDFTSYLAALKNEPNVAALLVHNEPGYHWIEDRVFDYNPQAKLKYRLWLQQKHGTVANLNKRWGTHYPSFDAVDPSTEISPVSNIGEWMDWRRFKADLIQNFLHFEVDLAHGLRPTLPVTTNLSGPLDNWYPVRLGDNYRFTANMDIAGVDIYPGEWTTPIMPGYSMDMSRGAADGRPLYVAEAEVFDPTRFHNLTEIQRAGMLRSEVWTFIGHGADAVVLWSLSGQDGFKLTQGEYNPRVSAVREISYTAKMLHVEQFRKPKATVALCVDQDSFLYYGGREPKLSGGQHADTSARNLYAALVGGKYQTDVISAAQIRQGKAQQYKTIVLSLPVQMDAVLAKNLKTFVAAGGLLIAEAPLAETDRWGNALASPAFGLDTLFGVNSVNAAPATNGIATFHGTTFAVAGLRAFSMKGASAIGTFGDGTPAITVNRFAKGKAIFIAGECGLPNVPNWTSFSSSPSGLQIFLSDVISNEVHVDRPRQGGQPVNGFVDETSRLDSRGNALHVYASQSNQGKPGPALVGERLTVPLHSEACEVFTFEASRVLNGRTMAGPVQLKAVDPKSRDQIFHLPQIDSALPVLEARNFGPLLSINAPSSAAAGERVDIRATCYNPSNQPISAELTLAMPEGWKAESKRISIRIPPHSDGTSVLYARSGGGERSVIKANLTLLLREQVVGKIDSIPVDVYLKR